ncbi:sortase [Aquibacillus sp. 3ASR75-11]|uniref:Sortase n=1 Tax=Terrihalobacillus insolitus TaxID=2950438 RepID=A0A9X3WW42_9BACI|nr:sortase [Terrihalobacillus insolitus]MDC3424499.1 sortase [Terrihalobacillus insolitus]
MRSRSTQKGVGHFRQSVLPGVADNSVLAGHRDSVFRRLGELEMGDVIITETNKGAFTYKITKQQIVDKDDRTIIVPSKKPILTVVTCYPFRYVGNAPKRYILTATLVASTLN